MQGLEELRSLAEVGNETQIGTLLLLDGDTPSPPAPVVAVRSSAFECAELFLSGPGALFYVLHFTAVKKSRQRDTFALSETARL